MILVNVARTVSSFSLAKVERKAPQMIAADIAEKINSQAFEKVVATGPYVNFFLDKAAISGQVLQNVITEKEHYADQTIGNQENVVIDMSSPNIAKPFSIGHLRSTVIGDSLSHIFQKIGYKTVKVNHLGDWGKQFGMLIVAYKKWGNEEAVKAHPIDELLIKLYIFQLIPLIEPISCMTLSRFLSPATKKVASP